MVAKRVWSAASLLALVLSSTSFGQLDLLPSIPKGSIQVNLQPIVFGMGGPVYGINAPGDPSRLFVLEQKGTIRILQNDALLPTPALDLGTRINPVLPPPIPLSVNSTLNLNSANDERGLLGLAFHPGYNNPVSPGYRTLYTFQSEPIPIGVAAEAPTYVAPNGAVNNYKMVVSEYKRDLVNPDIIDPSTRREVFSYGKTANNHNGGTLAFGPDGYMYLGTGDGGNANDVGVSHIEPGGNAVNLTTPLGKMLRFDPLDPALTPGSSDPVSSNGRYRIPADNPFQGAGQAKEIYAYGLRNPYRFAFDDLPGGNGKLIAADVGQGNIEEINLIIKGGNYGWASKEGDFLFDRSIGGAAGTGVRSPELPGSLLIDPISGVDGTLEYDHQDGISITGGFVYRGSAIPSLFGKYVFGDLALRTVGGVRVEGRMFYADLTTGKIEEFDIPAFANDIFPGGQTLRGFGQDGYGELYALVSNSPSGGTGGVIYRITAIPEPSALALLCISGFATVGYRSRKSRS